jgi:hypothetical protein
MAVHQVACVKPQWGESWQSQPALSGMSSAPLRRLHVPHRSWMFVMVLLPPLTPRDHMVEVEFNGRAAQTTPATVTCGYSDLHILTDGAGVALPDRSLVIWNPETPARRSGRPQRVGKPTRFRCPSERRYRPAGRRVEPNRRRRRVRLSHRTKSRVRGYPSTTVHSNTVDCVPDQGNDYWDGSVPA